MPGARGGMSSLGRKFNSIGSDGLGNRTAWSLVVEVLQLASSLSVFLVLPFLLSRNDYGVIVAVLGIATPAMSLTSFGSHALLLRRVAEGVPLGDAWKRTTSIGIVGPAVAAVLLIAIRPLVWPNLDGWVYTLLLISQLNFFWMSELATFVGTATKRLKDAAKIRTMVASTRFAAVGWFALFGGGKLLNWAIASVVSFGIAAVVSVYAVWRIFGVGPALNRLSKSDFKEGWPFSASGTTESLVDAADRPLMARYELLEDAGIYGLAGRVIQFGYLPIRILLRASDADMFAAGTKGTKPALALSRRLLPPALGVGVILSGCFLAFAPVLRLLPDRWDEIVPAVRWLAIMPTIRAVQYLMGNCLSASDRQRWRLSATFTAAILNLGLNLWLLPNGGWRTAVMTTIVSEVYLTVVLTAMAVWNASKEGDDTEICTSGIPDEPVIPVLQSASPNETSPSPGH